MSDKTYSISDFNANKIISIYFDNSILRQNNKFDKYVHKDNKERYWKNAPKINNCKLISINGTYGSGKSTIKNILLSKLENSVNFNSLEFEEKSQITSSLYYEISKNFSGTIRRKFKACAILKKESNIKFLGTDKIIFFFLLSSLLYLIPNIIKSIWKLFWLFMDSGDL